MRGAHHWSTHTRSRAHTKPRPRRERPRRPPSCSIQPGRPPPQQPPLMTSQPSMVHRCALLCFSLPQCLLCRPHLAPRCACIITPLVASLPLVHWYACFAARTSFLQPTWFPAVLAAPSCAVISSVHQEFASISLRCVVHTPSWGSSVSWPWSQYM